MGMSLSTDPSIHLCGEGSQGTASPVLGSFASREAAEKMNGTEHDAALETYQRHESNPNQRIPLTLQTILKHSAL